MPKVAKDTQARIGCKSKNKYWYGFKKHVCVDMQSGLINKVAITPANVTDGKGLSHVYPYTGAIYADKAYCVKSARHASEGQGCHLAAIKKNNMIGKNKDLDSWLTKIRAHYEGIEKNQFSAFMEAICQNLKRLSVLSAPHLELS